jgi:pyruvate/2-oxoglutarate dehydrogenase complex dihydrolipoamide acyltransferase (E2) component
MENLCFTGLQQAITDLGIYGQQFGTPIIVQSVVGYDHRIIDGADADQGGGERLSRELSDDIG